jgi:hypothetical protein
MARSDTAAVVAVEMLVKKYKVLPVRIFSIELSIAVTRPRAVRSRAKE